MVVIKNLRDRKKPLRLYGQENLKTPDEITEKIGPDLNTFLSEGSGTALHDIYGQYSRGPESFYQDGEVPSYYGEGNPDGTILQVSLVVERKEVDLQEREPLTMSLIDLVVRVVIMISNLVLVNSSQIIITGNPKNLVKILKVKSLG